MNTVCSYITQLFIQQLDRKLLKITSKIVIHRIFLIHKKIHIPPICYLEVLRARLTNIFRHRQILVSSTFQSERQESLKLV